MQRTMLKSTIHRATVTQANLHHVGSLTIDQDLMDAADLLAGEQVAVVDVTNGARLDTHVVPGDRGSGVIGVNGAAAYLIAPGDLVVVSSYGVFDDADARAHEPLLVLVDADNRASDPAADPADDAAGRTAAGAGDDADGAPAETDDAARLDALIQAGA